MTDLQRAMLRMFCLVPMKIPAPGSVASADLRTSMCDARAAVVLAMGRTPDSMGYVVAEPGQLTEAAA